MKKLLLMAVMVFAACSDPMSPVKELQKIDVLVGSGLEATQGKKLTVHYSGYLYDESKSDHRGSLFDSSVGRGVPYGPFTLGDINLIEGWNVGLVGMRVGGKRTLIIPPSMAYGKSGKGSIPGNAALVFDVELLAVQ